MLIRLRRPLFLLVPALCVALFTGDCTNLDEGEVEAWVPFAAAVLAAGVVLLVGAVLLAARHTELPSIVWAVCVGATCLGMLLAVRASATGLIAAFFMMNALVALGVGLGVGMLVGQALGSGRGFAVGVSGFVAVVAGQVCLVAAYLVSADICIGLMGVDCGRTDPIKWERFALLVGFGSGMTALVPALLTWLLSRSGRGHAAGPTPEH